jgi:hypothetical protein
VDDPEYGEPGPLGQRSDRLEAVAERLDVLARAVGGMRAPSDIADLVERRTSP